MTDPGGTKGGGGGGPFKFLRKGEGVSRFQGPRSRRNSSNSEPSQEMRPTTSSSQLPNFKLKQNVAPSTARTDPDSGKGISPFFENEDHTRPPTADTISLDVYPIDSMNSRKQPMVVEENDIYSSHSGQNFEPNNDTEEVSAMQSRGETCVSDSGASLESSMPSTNCEDLSDNQREHRERCKRMKQKALENQEANSLNSPMTSEMSAPIGQSTPINSEMAIIPRMNLGSPESTPTGSSSSGQQPGGRVFDSSQFRHNISTILESPPPAPAPKPPTKKVTSGSAQTGASLLKFGINRHEPITPVVRRPFASNRINTNAQTGRSLLEPDLNGQRKSNLRNVPQKENFGNVPLSHHVYDEPIRRNVVNTDMERNLILQLRDTIAHLDYASSQVTRTEKQMKEGMEKMKKNFETRHRELENSYKTKMERVKKELEEEYAKKYENMTENLRIEMERVEREKGDLQRERNLMRKEAVKKKEEDEKAKEDHRKKVNALEDKISQMRVEVRNKDEKNKIKDEEMERMKKEVERCRKNLAITETNLRLLRSEKNKDEKKKKTFQEEQQRMGFCPMRRSASSSASTSGAVPFGQQQQQQQPQNQSVLAYNIENPNQNSQHAQQKKGRSVSFADSVESGYTSFDPFYGMRVTENVSGEFGPCEVYSDGFNNFTKVTKTIENGTLSHYMNGDTRWVNASQTIVLYYYASRAMLKIDLVPSNIMILFVANRQMEIRRPGQQYSLVSYNRDEVRTEVIRDGQLTLVETYDKDGTLILRDNRRVPQRQKYEINRMTSFRDEQQRYVQVISYDAFEYVEPEFRLLYHQGETVSAKFFSRSSRIREKTLKFGMDTKTNEGELCAIDTSRGTVQRNVIFKWSGTHI